MDTVELLLVGMLVIACLSAIALAGYPQEIKQMLATYLPPEGYPKAISASHILSEQVSNTTIITISDTNVVLLQALCSGSMQPTFGCNSTVYGEVLEADDEIRKFDIVVYNASDGDLVSHRVVGINQDGSYRLRGDSNPIDDEPVRREQMLYRIIGIWYTEG